MIARLTATAGTLLLILTGCATPVERSAAGEEVGAASAVVTCPQRSSLINLTDDFVVSFSNQTPGTLELGVDAIDCNRKPPTFLPEWYVENSQWVTSHNPTQFIGTSLEAGAISEGKLIESTRVCRSIPPLGRQSVPIDWTMRFGYTVDDVAYTASLPLSIGCRGNLRFDRVATMCDTRMAEVYDLPLYNAATGEEEFAELRATVVCPQTGSDVVITLQQLI